MPKAKRLSLHVVPIEGGWQVKSSDKIYATYLRTANEKKSDAVSFARIICRTNKPAQIVIHTRDGKIQEERSYGDDPRRTKG